MLALWAPSSLPIVAGRIPAHQPEEVTIFSLRMSGALRLFSILQCANQVLIASLLFSQTKLAGVQVCGLSVVLRFRLAFCACSLAICQGSLSPLTLGTCTGSRPQGRGIWVRHVEQQGCLWTTVGGIHGQGAPSGSWASCLMEAMVQLVGSASL